jgi:hypothetical protein
VGRSGCDPAEVDLLYPEGIGRPEYGTYVVEAAHIVQYQYQRCLFGFFELFGADTAQLGVFSFAVDHGGKNSEE